jgi:hypothetical protein
MAGRVVPVIPARTLDFSGLSMNQSLDLVLLRGIDVSEWIAVALLVRASSLDLAGGSVFVTAYLEGLTCEDPGVEFVQPAVGEGAIGVFIDSGTAVPFFTSLPLFIPVGSALRIVARGSRTAASGNVSATLSVDVSLKNGY